MSDNDVDDNDDEWSSPGGTIKSNIVDRTLTGSQCLLRAIGKFIQCLLLPDYKGEPMLEKYIQKGELYPSHQTSDLWHR